MTKNDLITIGMPCFNAQDTISRALESALSQTWDNKEILIIDDASTDQSAQIIKDYMSENPNIKLIQHTSNQGVAETRQTILKHAQGIFVAFFDDDDESLPQRIETQYEHILAYENKTGELLIACYASGQRIYPNGYVMDINAIGSKPVVPYGELLADRLLFYGGDSSFFYGNGTPTCSLMARKSTMIKAGGFDSNFRRVEDIDFAVRLALAGGHFIGSAEPIFIQYATESLDKAPEKNLEAELQLVEKHKDYLQSKNRYIYAKKWPLLRYHHFKGQYVRMITVLLELLMRYPFKTFFHFLTTMPRRFLHERKMKKRQK